MANHLALAAELADAIDPDIPEHQRMEIAERIARTAPVDALVMLACFTCGLVVGLADATGRPPAEVMHRIRAMFAHTPTEGQA